MRIRTAQAPDAAAILQHDAHISARELQNLIRLERVYVLQAGGRFAGWLRYGLFWDNTPFLNMLFLLEGERRKGYGRALVRHWEARMRALGYTTVMTSTAANEYAQHFYQKLGYTPVGGFTPGGQPYELLLEKRL